MTGLCELVDEYGDLLEADFTEFYNLDIADVWRGTLTPRRALVLAEQLAAQPCSRYRAAILGDPHFLGWTQEAEVLADLYDALIDNSIITAKSAGGKPGKPDPYPRPQRAAVTDTVDVPTIDDFPIHLVMKMTAQ